MWLHDVVQVGVLGPLLVRVGDREATPRGQRQREAFVALVQRRGRPVLADGLHDLTWGSGRGDPGLNRPTGPPAGAPAFGELARMFRDMVVEAANRLGAQSAGPETASARSAGAGS
ncbi:MAG TPA: hypothetical protein VIC62_22245 [Nakamurella sp.]|jgi:hypothetical protein